MRWVAVSSTVGMFMSFAQIQRKKGKPPAETGGNLSRYERRRTGPKAENSRSLIVKQESLFRKWFLGPVLRLAFGSHLNKRGVIVTKSQLIELIVLVIKVIILVTEITAIIR